MTTIRRANITDTEAIQKLAAEVWWPTYSPILSKEQIEYMLGRMYDANVIREQILTGTQSYILLYAEEELTGFAAYSPRPENKDVYKLHKLYCHTSTKGMGYGKQLLQAVEKAVLGAGKSILELNVNRSNPAIGFYEKMGFSIAYTEDINIGNGYEMNDYVMQKQLQKD